MSTLRLNKDRGPSALFSSPNEIQTRLQGIEKTLKEATEEILKEYNEASAKESDYPKRFSLYNKALEDLGEKIKKAHTDFLEVKIQYTNQKADIFHKVIKNVQDYLSQDKEMLDKFNKALEKNAQPKESRPKVVDSNCRFK